MEILVQYLCRTAEPLAIAMTKVHRKAAEQRLTRLDPPLSARVDPVSWTREAAISLRNPERVYLP